MKPTSAGRGFRKPIIFRSGMGEWRGYSAPDDGENRPECVDLISDVLPFGRLWYGEPNAITQSPMQSAMQNSTAGHMML
jgi:hypothetical protein